MGGSGVKYRGGAILSGVAHHAPIARILLRGTRVDSSVQRHKTYFPGIMYILVYSKTLSNPTGDIHTFTLPVPHSKLLDACPLCGYAVYTSG